MSLKSLLKDRSVLSNMYSDLPKNLLYIENKLKKDTLIMAGSTISSFVAAVVGEHALAGILGIMSIYKADALKHHYTQWKHHLGALTSLVNYQSTVKVSEFKEPTPQTLPKLLRIDNAMYLAVTLNMNNFLEKNIEKSLKTDKDYDLQTENPDNLFTGQRSMFRWVSDSAINSKKSLDSQIKNIDPKCEVIASTLLDSNGFMDFYYLN